MVSDPFSSDRDVEDIQPHVFKPEERLVAHAMPMKHQIAGPGPLAIISDIHGNLEALTGVLAEIDARGVKRIICLGDIVGYGPNPLECIDMVMQRCEFSLMGNHDFAIFYEPYNFNPAAENAAYWTRTQFEWTPTSTVEPPLEVHRLHAHAHGQRPLRLFSRLAAPPYQ